MCRGHCLGSIDWLLLNPLLCFLMRFLKNYGYKKTKACLCCPSHFTFLVGHTFLPFFLFLEATRNRTP